MNNNNNNTIGNLLYTRSHPSTGSVGFGRQSLDYTPVLHSSTTIATPHTPPDSAIHIGLWTPSIFHQHSLYDLIFQAEYWDPDPIFDLFQHALAAEPCPVPDPRDGHHYAIPQTQQTPRDTAYYDSLAEMHGNRMLTKIKAIQKQFQSGLFSNVKITLSHPTSPDYQIPNIAPRLHHHNSFLLTRVDPAALTNQTIRGGLLPNFNNNTNNNNKNNNTHDVDFNHNNVEEQDDGAAISQLPPTTTTTTIRDNTILHPYPSTTYIQQNHKQQDNYQQFVHYLRDEYSSELDDVLIISAESLATQHFNNIQDLYEMNKSSILHRSQILDDNKATTLNVLLAQAKTFTDAQVPLILAHLESQKAHQKRKKNQSHHNQTQITIDGDDGNGDANNESNNDDEYNVDDQIPADSMGSTFAAPIWFQNKERGWERDRYCTDDDRHVFFCASYPRTQFAKHVLPSLLVEDNNNGNNSNNNGNNNHIIPYIKDRFTGKASFNDSRLQIKKLLQLTSPTSHGDDLPFRGINNSSTTTNPKIQQLECEQNETFFIVSGVDSTYMPKNDTSSSSKSNIDKSTALYYVEPPVYPIYNPAGWDIPIKSLNGGLTYYSVLKHINPQLLNYYQFLYTTHLHFHTIPGLLYQSSQQTMCRVEPEMTGDLFWKELYSFWICRVFNRFELFFGNDSPIVLNDQGFDGCLPITECSQFPYYFNKLFETRGITIDEARAIYERDRNDNLIDSDGDDEDDGDIIIGEGIEFERLEQQSIDQDDTQISQTTIPTPPPNIPPFSTDMLNTNQNKKKSSLSSTSKGKNNNNTVQPKSSISSDAQQKKESTEKAATMTTPVDIMRYIHLLPSFQQYQRKAQIAGDNGNINISTFYRNPFLQEPQHDGFVASYSYRLERQTLYARFATLYQQQYGDMLFLNTNQNISLLVDYHNVDTFKATIHMLTFLDQYFTLFLKSSSSSSSLSTSLSSSIVPPNINDVYNNSNQQSSNNSNNSNSGSNTKNNSKSNTKTNNNNNNDNEDNIINKHIANHITPRRVLLPESKQWGIYTINPQAQQSHLLVWIELEIINDIITFFKQSFFQQHQQQQQQQCSKNTDNDYLHQHDYSNNINSNNNNNTNNNYKINNTSIIYECFDFIQMILINDVFVEYGDSLAYDEELFNIRDMIIKELQKIKIYHHNLFVKLQRYNYNNKNICQINKDHITCFCSHCYDNPIGYIDHRYPVLYRKQDLIQEHKRKSYNIESILLDITMMQHHRAVIGNAMNNVHFESKIFNNNQHKLNKKNKINIKKNNTKNININNSTSNIDITSTSSSQIALDQYTTFDYYRAINKRVNHDNSYNIHQQTNNDDDKDDDNNSNNDIYDNDNDDIYDACSDTNCDSSSSSSSSSESDNDDINDDDNSNDKRNNNNNNNNKNISPFTSYHDNLKENQNKNISFLNIPSHYYYNNHNENTRLLPIHPNRLLPHVLQHHPIRLLNNNRQINILFWKSDMALDSREIVQRRQYIEDWIQYFQDKFSSSAFNLHINTYNIPSPQPASTLHRTLMQVMGVIVTNTIITDAMLHKIDYNKSKYIASQRTSSSSSSLCDIM